VADIDNKPPLRIGLTGGIASGKTTVANMFADLGVPVIDTDVIAREIVQPGEPALDDIRKRFGESMITADGHLDRGAMRNLIFSDDTARSKLEKLMHPRIGVSVRHQSAIASGPYQVIVVPLLVGSPLLSFVDRVLVVDCDESTQVQRLLARDAETVEQAQKILSAQSSREDRLAIADDIVNNELGLDALEKQVLALDSSYRRDR